MYMDFRIYRYRERESSNLLILKIGMEQIVSKLVGYE